MSEQTESLPSEFDVMRDVHARLLPLPAEAQARVLRYIADVLKVEGLSRAPSVPSTGRVSAGVEQSAPVDSSRFKEFAELFDACSPNTNAEKALVAGYWVQVLGGAESFDSQSANTLVKHLGHAIPNITDALSTLIAQKPAPVLQLKKSGTSKQARKTYKVTTAGIKAVERMLSGGHADE